MALIAQQNTRQWLSSLSQIHSEKVRTDELRNLQEPNTVFAIEYLLQLLVADYNLLVLWILENKYYSVFSHQTSHKQIYMTTMSSNLFISLKSYITKGQGTIENLRPPNHNMRTYTKANVQSELRKTPASTFVSIRQSSKNE